MCWAVKNFCLLCLTNTKPVVGDQQDPKIAQISALCQLVQNSRFDNHINNAEQVLTGVCALCNECSGITDEADGLQLQILQLQSELRSKVLVIRGKILDSECQREQLLQSQNDAIEIDKLHSIRQSLLNLSDEETYLPGNVQVKVKIETEDNELEPEFFDPTSPLSFFLQPDESLKEEFDGDRDSDCPLIIKPQNQRRVSTRHRKQRITLPVEADTPKRKRGRPRKTDSKPPQNTPYKRGRKCKAKKDEISSDSEHNSDSDQSDWDSSHEEKRNDKDGLFKCDTCGRQYDSQMMLNRHTIKIHGKYDCLLCHKTFKSRKEVNDHQKFEHKGTAPHHCKLCKRKFFRKGSLQTHMVIRHETKEKNYTCEICKKEFTLQINFERHTELHRLDSVKPLVCDVCDSRFSNEQRLERHSTTHSKSFECNYCHQNYTSKSGVLRHERIHTGEKPFSCNECSETFIDGAAKQWHMQKVHKKEQHVCPICGKSFLNSYILKAHMDRHEGKHEVSCEACGERFSDRGALKTHSIMKHNKEALICDECGSNFMTSKGLKQHKLKHANIKPHECSECKARFLSKWVLENHMRSHTGERPFLCVNCGKGFKAKKHLDTHVKSIHSEDYVLKTPFECSYCGKAYPRKGILEGHVRQSHTGERPFTCEVCQKGFALKTTLRLHLKSHGIEVSVQGQRLPRSKREKFSPPPLKQGIEAQLPIHNDTASVSTISASSTPTPVVDYTANSSLLPANVKFSVNNGNTRTSAGNSANSSSNNSSFFTPSLSHYYQL